MATYIQLVIVCVEAVELQIKLNQKTLAYTTSVID